MTVNAHGSVIIARTGTLATAVALLAGRVRSTADDVDVPVTGSVPHPPLRLASRR